MKDIVIVDGARTPFGTFMGSLKGFTATELGVIAARAALERAKIDPASVDGVVFGNVLQTSPDAIYLARHIGLKAGAPIETPALTVNRLCGSGLEAIVQGARLIQLGEAAVVLAGGAENMSQAPHQIYGARDGLALGQGQLVDYLWASLVDSYNQLGMALTTENLVEKYGISREESDEFALRSHQLAAAAQDAGRLAEEIVPVELKDRKGNVTLFAHDEHVRRDVSAEKMAGLSARFKKGGTVTPGNASGINDGAAAVVLMSREQAEAENREPLGRLVAWGTSGVHPDIMGIGPAPSSRQALQRAGLTLADIDVVEINEAFAGQYLAVERELGLDRAKVNLNGGGVAIGHPLAASGARLTVATLYELRRRGGRYGLLSMCIGGGQGIAAVVENLQR
ncbi:MAG TPA: acetyl-CoA C-acetyltransferase [Herpetosiphonaceae bacterium]